MFSKEVKGNTPVRGQTREFEGAGVQQQVDILISKNQALQILYLKHHAYKSLWIRNLMKST